MPQADMPTPTQLMDWAEHAYAQFFPDHQSDQSSGPYVYRYYPATGNYLGVADGQIYVLGPISASQLLRVGSVADYACGVNPEPCGLRISPDYFPTGAGNWWAYDVWGPQGAFPSHDSQVNSAAVQLASGPARRFDQSNGLVTGDSVTASVRKDDRALVHLDDTTPAILNPVPGTYDIARFDGTFMASPLAVRTNVDAGVDNDGDGIDEHYDIQLTGVIEGFEDVVTPAGVFKDALKLRYDTMKVMHNSKGGDYPLKSSVREWRALGIGVVRRESWQLVVASQTRTEQLRGYMADGQVAGAIGPETILDNLGSTSSDTPGSPAVASDGQHFLVVSGSAQTVHGRQIVARFVEPDGQMQPAISVDPTDWVQGHSVGVAWNGAQYLVIAAKGYDGLRGQRISAAGTVLDVNPGITIAPEVYGAYAAIAGGPGQWLVVYANKNSIYGRVVSGSGDAGAAFLIADGATDDARPAVAFDGTNFLVAWEAGVGSYDPTQTDLYGRIVSPDGVPVGSAFPISTAPQEQRAPRIACDPQNCLVTWRDKRGTTSPSNLLPGQGTVYGAFVTRSGALLNGDAVSGAFPVGSSLTSIWPEGALVFTGTDYVTAWTGGNYDEMNQLASGGMFAARVSTEGAVSPMPLSLRAGRDRFYPALASIPSRSGVLAVWLNEVDTGAPSRVEGDMIFPTPDR
jgi:hypothetical protein